MWEHRKSEYLAIQHGGKNNIQFKRKDISNLIAADNGRLKGVDVHTTLMYFLKKKEADPEFFYSIEADENGVVKNIFWVDGRARRAYQEFGDVVTFDTTYPTKCWIAMIDRYSLHENNYMKVLYNTRMQWVPVFFRDTFFADISTTQRSESMNAPFKLLVNNHKSIFQFVLQIDKLIESIWQRESDEDLKTLNEIPNLWSNYRIEVRERQLYTRNVFSLFKEIVKESTLGTVNEIERDASFQVSIDYHPSISNFIPESYKVEVDKELYRVSCNCKGYVINGILCPHAIKVMNHVGMTQLPDHYIMKRWTKDANASVKRSASERAMDSGESPELQTLRFASVKSNLMELDKIGSTTSDAFSQLKN